jgi:formiminoglutamase
MLNDFNVLFTPVDNSKIDVSGFSNPKDLLLNQVCFFNHLTLNKQIETFDIAVLGIPEDRNSLFNKGSAKAPDNIRNELYKLYKPGKSKIIDLGNLIIGKNIKDTYTVVSEILLELFKN